LEGKEMKKYTFKAVVKKGKLYTSGTSEGFNGREVLYILVHKCQED
jgi:hypothetical protein